MEVDCATTDRVGRGNGSIREPSWGARPNRARAGLIGRIACGTGLWTLTACDVRVDDPIFVVRMVVPYAALIPDRRSVASRLVFIRL